MKKAEKLLIAEIERLQGKIDMAVGDLGNPNFYDDEEMVESIERAIAEYTEEIRELEAAVYTFRHSPENIEEYQDRLAWQREMANEAGMLMGVDAFNEVMGY